MRVLSFLLFAIAFALLVWWFASGHAMWTTTQHLVTVETKDEIFGTVTQTQVWQKGFTPGLEFFGPIAALLMGFGVWAMGHRRWGQLVVAGAVIAGAVAAWKSFM